MSSQPAEQTANKDPDFEKRVADYLLNHPDFFVRHTDVLTAIQVPHLVGDGAVSLIEYQIRLLRQQLESERGRLTHLIVRAREYEALSARLHGLVLQLISVKDPEHLFTLLKEALLREFHAEAVALKLLPLAAEDAGMAHLTLAFQDFVDTERTLCGPLDESRALMLFGKPGTAIKTAALVPVQVEGRSGVLAIGSADPERFHPDMGTEFLDRLGEILSHKLRTIPLERYGHA